MPIPTYDKLLRPILDLAAKDPISRRAAADAMIAHFKLTPEESERRLQSGKTTFVRNRAGWAMTFLTKGGLIEKAGKNSYRATLAGQVFLKTHPEEIKVADLKQIDGWEAAWEAGKEKRRAAAAAETGEPVNESTATPHEIIAREITALDTDLRGRLLQAIVDQSPEFFERLVLDVLVAMGYGGSREDAAEHLGQSGDEGIDGRINQDVLGLDQVLVQAKRYRPDRTVDRKEVQAFVGSLSGQGVTKGVFITTSSFVASARDFVARGLNTKVVLVDGKMLIDLMIRHKIGVRVVETHEVKELDQNYFEEEE
jgi:restriction system protein